MQKPGLFSILQKILPMNLKTTILLFLVFVTATTQAQSFTGIYSMGNNVFKARLLSEESRQVELYEIEYVKGMEKTTVIKTEHPTFKYVFQEYDGDKLLGTFYFISAWKGKPSQGYYTKADTKEKLPVKFILNGRIKREREQVSNGFVSK